MEYSPEQLAALSTEALTNYRIAEAQQVQMPYMIISIVLICLALAIAFTRFPSVSFSKSKSSATPFLTIFQHKSFLGAIVGQFF